MCTLTAVYQVSVTGCSSTTLSGTFVRGTVVCSAGKTAAFHTFECVFKSLQITKTSVPLIFYKGDINSLGGSRQATRAEAPS
jgi:hypothetical protein